MINGFRGLVGTGGRKQNEDFYMYVVDVDKEKCVGCGKCAAGCPKKVFDMEGGKSNPARPLDCDGNRFCVKNCPVKAIRVYADLV